MYLNLAISACILGLALLIRSLFSDNLFEFKKPFLIIVGVFLIAYLSAVIFISYRTNAWGAVPQTASPSTQSPYITEDKLQPVDLTTGP